MFLGEPPRSQGDFQFPIAGFNIRVTPWFWLATALLGIRNDDPRLVVVWVIAVFISIVIHELGHAFAFRYYGYNAHIVLYHFGGLAIPAGGRNVRQSQHSQIVIAAAGPALQVIAAAILIGGLAATGNNVPLDGFIGRWLGFGGGYPAPNDMLGHFVMYFLYVSVYWAFVNLFPIYPLDGGQISRELFLIYDRSNAIKNSLILSMVTAGAVAIYGITADRTYLGIMFGMLAYSNYTTLQSFMGHGGGYGRGW